MKSLLLLFVLATAGAAAHAAETYRVGAKVISVGDGVGKVTQAIGAPDRIEPIENKHGANIGERYEYFRDGKTVQITIADGKVTRIEELR